MAESHRVAAAHPVPEAEHVGGVDAELADLLRVRADGDEVPRDGRRVTAQTGQQPVPCRPCVGQRLERGERLAGDDEQRLGGVEVDDRLADVCAVDVGDEPEAQRAVGVVPQRLGRHGGAQVGTADADVDDVPDPAAGEPQPFAAPDPHRERGHAVQHLVDAGYHVVAVHLDDRIGGGSQRRVEDGPVLGHVDPFAGEHGLPSRLHACGSREREQQRDRLAGDPVLRVVEVQARALGGQALCPARILGEEIPQAAVPERGAVGDERPPLGGLVDGAGSVRSHGQGSVQRGWARRRTLRATRSCRDRSHPCPRAPRRDDRCLTPAPMAAHTHLRPAMLPE